VGNLIESIHQIKDKIILFVKRDPGLNLTDVEYSHVIRTLDRDQRIRQKPTVSLIETKSQQMINQKSQSNYHKLLEEQIINATQLESWHLNPRGQSKTKKSKVREKLWKCAREVLEMEQKLELSGGIDIGIK